MAVASAGLSLFTVYITPADGQCAVAIFSKSRVWDNVPHGSTLIFSVVKVSKIAAKTWVFSKSIHHQELTFTTIVKGFEAYV